MKNLIFLIFTASLTACTTFSTQPTWTSPKNTLGQHYLTKAQRYQQLTALTAWRVNGSIAIHNSKKGWNASFAWQQTPYHYALQLFGPLGSDHVQLSSQPGLSILQTTQHTYSAANTDLLLEQQLGYKLPANSLSYWLRGLTVPKVRSRQAYDMNNHIAELTQEGWHVIYLRYTAMGDIDLPQRILLTNPPWVAHIIIHRWELQ